MKGRSLGRSQPFLCVEAMAKTLVGTEIGNQGGAMGGIKPAAVREALRPSSLSSP